MRECELYFENGHNPFGRFKRIKSHQFVSQYNKLFNSKDVLKLLKNDVYRFKLQLKIQELRVIYTSLSTGSKAENSKRRFKELFGVEWDGQYELINDRVKFWVDKLEQLPKEKNEGITFSELVALVENSRGVHIDRNLKLFEFHRIYQLELKKWQQT